MRMRLVVLLAAAAVLAFAAPAFAGPRLVRVIWDVGNAQVYYRVESRVKAGPDPFEVPRDAAAAKEQKFETLGKTTSPILNKGDKVRLYVVNYNPVSHVWSDNSTVEQVPLAPPLPEVLLNASFLSMIGAGKFPSGAVNIQLNNYDPGAKKSCDDVLSNIRTAADALRKAFEEALDAELRLEKDAIDKQFLSEAKAVAKLPAADEVWIAFDDAAAWAAIRKTLGHDFTETSKWLGESLKNIDGLMERVRAAQIATDLAVIKAGDVGDCEDEEKALLRLRDLRLAMLRSLTGSDSVYAGLAAKFKETDILWKGFHDKLAATNWTTEAVEVVVKDAIQPATVLRVDGVFTSTDKNSTARLQRALVLEVAPELPTLVISSGVAFNKFQFKQLQVVKTTATADGSAKDQFVLADDTSIERIVPVWFENIRIIRRSQVGLYGTFGTTPDRNIFKNAIVGGTAYVAKWRTAFTAGKMMVRGYVEDDLTPFKTQFSDSAGFVLSGVTASNLPLPKKPRHYSWFFGVTFGIATF